MDSIDILITAKRTATGVGLSVESPDFKPVCASKGDFDELVSSYYKFFHEELSVDIGFLRNIRRRPEIESFTSVLRKLRTGAQHSSNSDAKIYYKSWTGQFPDNQTAADILAEQLQLALKFLAQNAVLASRNEQHRLSWVDITSTDVSSIMQAVVMDLGLNFTPRRLEYMVRQVNQRLLVQPGSGSQQATAQEYCVQELVSQNKPLPERYFTVLDHLGLLGDDTARGAILVAYSVATIAPSLRGTDFLHRVEQTWRAAAAY
ncbi:hypothetical protein [uncultured Kocuria sp.]|uniref:hypothetical protein n=1 Tax=uncultured Kocuria sp. TaxID=259305 RepID=UPI00261CB3A9|nr:hypothetical protein [uncultured Kocuria sp.]